jgi:hypothetical protein
MAPPTAPLYCPKRPKIMHSNCASETISAAQKLWIQEVCDRREVCVPILRRGVLYEIDGPLVGTGGENIRTARRELVEICESADIAFSHRDQAAVPAGLGIRAAGRVCIDVVLVGPLDLAADMLAEDPELYAAARERQASARPSHDWKPRISSILALADARRAARCIEEVLHGL